MTNLIVVPIDLSPASEIALAAGVGAAELLGVDQIRLVHVVPDLTPWMTNLEMTAGPALDNALAKLMASSKARLADLSSTSEVNIAKEVRVGVPAREIVDVIAKSGADLAVIATHDRGRASRALLGSTPHTVLRASPCPVLVVGEGRPWTAPRRILAAVDLSAGSERVLTAAIRFASAAGAEIEVLSSYDLIWLTPEWQQAVPLPLSDHDRAALKARYAEALDELIARMDTRGARLTANVLSDHPPSKVILSRAKAIGADLIVIGTSGHSAWQRLLMGSTATRVISEAAVPVLAVPPRDDE